MDVENQPEDTGRWNVATACDTNIGQLFKNGDFPQGAILNVDNRAIETTLELLSTPETPDNENVRFIVMGPGSKSQWNPMIGAYAGGTAQELPDKNVTEVKVYTTQPKDSESKPTQPIRDLISRIRSIRKDRKVFEEQNETAVSNDNRSEYSLSDESYVHSTAVHELQHAVDFTDESIIERHKEHHVRAIKSLFSRFVVWGAVGGGVGYKLSSELINAQSWDICIAGWCAVTAGAFIGNRGKKGVAKEHFYAYFNSPLEVRAQYQQERASEFPKMIYLTESNSAENVQNTNMGDI
ncbi:MAG: hypothetical protein U0524_01005 [Candidatus Saccharimonadales bacterium]